MQQLKTLFYQRLHKNIFLQTQKKRDKLTFLMHNRRCFFFAVLTMSSFQINGKVAVVTGGASGIGLEYVKELLRCQAKVRK